MGSASAEEIREHIARYLAGEISARQLEDWFVPATWDIERTSDAEATRLADVVMGLLVESTAPGMTEQDLRDGLRELAVSFAMRTDS